MQRGRYSSAIQQSYNWMTPTGPTSNIEAHAQSLRALTLSEVHRALGELDVARAYLEKVCLSHNGEKDVYYPEFCCRLLDVYNDISLLAEGQTLVDRAMRNGSFLLGSPTRRHILASRMDLHMLALRYSNAEELARSLDGMLKRLDFFTADDELFLTRLRVTIAQISYVRSQDPANAIGPWMDALQYMRDSQNFQGQGYVEVAFFSLSSISRKKGYEQAAAYFDCGMRIREVRSKRRGIPRLEKLVI
jgi:hypothetical protein